MILSDIKKFIVEKQSASLQDLVNYFRSEPDVIRSMLQIWIGKGCISRAPAVAGCGVSCSKCNPLLTEVYQWRGVA